MRYFDFMSNCRVSKEKDIQKAIEWLHNHPDYEVGSVRFEPKTQYLPQVLVAYAEHYLKDEIERVKKKEVSASVAYSSTYDVSQEEMTGFLEGFRAAIKLIKGE